jgi:hypothetical protein
LHVGVSAVIPTCHGHATKQHFAWQVEDEIEVQRRQMRPPLRALIDFLKAYD